MSDERLLIFSCDGHVGGPPDVYLDYIDPQYRDDLVALQKENDEWARNTIRHGFEAEEYQDIKHSGVTDPRYLLEVLDGDGVAGQLLLYGHGLATTPFFSVANDPYPPELRAAGAKAHHRWLADFAAGGDGRLAPVGEPGPCLDMTDSVAEMEWIADQGFAGVYMPGATRDPSLPAVYAPHFDPFWAICEERGLVIVFHAAYGAEQGQVLSLLRDKPAMRERLIAKDPKFASLEVEKMLAVELLELGGGDPDMMTKFMNRKAVPPARKALAHLMLGGVFDRFPALKVLVVELRGDWVPPTIVHLDAMAADSGLSLELTPSEYFQRNVWVAPSSPRPSEVAMRHEIGIERFLFATDYPHPEGTWPHTLDWIRATCQDVPEDELRMILGGNAIPFLGLDWAPLQKAAERIGPRPSDIYTGTPVDSSLIKDFDRRAGFSTPAEQINLAAVDSWFPKELVSN